MSAALATEFANPGFIIRPQDGFFVLRDDLISGGTKRRALTFLLQKTPQSRIAYAGTVMGHGALALAHAAQDCGKKAHIFIATDNIDHPILEKIQGTGALLHLEEPQPINTLYAAAQTWQSANDSVLFPPGFDMPDFEECMIDAVRGLDVSPYPEIWTTSVTGTLTRCLKRAFPHKVFKTVSVVKLGGPADFTTPEKYHQAAIESAPYPSCPYTDSKLWQFARNHATPGALLWNTAG